MCGPWRTHMRGLCDRRKPTHMRGSWPTQTELLKKKLNS